MYEIIENLDYPKDRLRSSNDDDFSTDSTPSILREAEKKIHIWIFQSSDFPSTHLEAKARGMKTLSKQM